MSGAPHSVGRRERNKQDKLDRITSAARELFAEHGVDEVTTQQIADKADIGAGTLFLYARTKGELLLLVQNSDYADALVKGKAAAEKIPDVLTAVMAIIRPVVHATAPGSTTAEPICARWSSVIPGNLTTATLSV